MLQPAPLWVSGCPDPQASVRGTFCGDAEAGAGKEQVLGSLGATVQCGGRQRQGSVWSSRRERQRLTLKTPLRSPSSPATFKAGTGFGPPACTLGMNDFVSLSGQEKRLFCSAWKGRGFRNVTAAKVPWSPATPVRLRVYGCLRTFQHRPPGPRKPRGASVSLQTVQSPPAVVPPRCDLCVPLSSLLVFICTPGTPRSQVLQGHFLRVNLVPAERLTASGQVMH